MNQTTDPGTPIFGELNKELGELPEIDIHDFDWHGIEFPTDASSEGTAQAEDAQSAEAQKAEKAGRAGGRRRRKA